MHRLRVATRRAGATLGVFRPLLRPKRRREVSALLRSVRRAAGGARECDVHASILAGWLESERDPKIAGAIGYTIASIDRERAGHTRTLARLHKRGATRSIRAARRALLERGVRTGGPGRGARDFGELARTSVDRLVRDMMGAAGADLSVLANVHALRIAGKRVRYALEVTGPALGDRRDAGSQKRFKAFQDRLGGINDLSEVRERVRGLGAALVAGDDAESSTALLDGLDRLESSISERLDAAHRAFVAWWTGEGAATLLAGLTIKPEPEAPAEDAGLERAVSFAIEDARAQASSAREAGGGGGAGG